MFRLVKPSAYKSINSSSVLLDINIIDADRRNSIEKTTFNKPSYTNTNTTERKLNTDPK